MENTENDLALNDLKLYNKKMKSIINTSNQVFMFQMLLIIMVFAFVYFDN